MTPLVFLHGWGATSASFAGIRRAFEGVFPCIFVEFDCNPDRVMTLDDYVQHVENILVQHRVTRCNILAHSFGARVAVLLARRNPHMINKMVLTGAAGLRPKFSLRVAFKIRMYKVFKIGRGSVEYQKLTPSGKRTFQNIINRDLAPEITRLKTPTALIYGKNDKSTPIYMAKRWTRLQKGAMLHLYARCGHFAFIDCPDRFTHDALNYFTGDN
jgi:pimeloyl-ACP methyl ester carboxylesterase